MEYLRYRKLLIIAYGYLALGCLGIVSGFIYLHLFPGELSDLTFGAKVGVFAILVYMILWCIFFFVLLSSKYGKEFQVAYEKYSGEKKKLREINKRTIK